MFLTHTLNLKHGCHDIEQNQSLLKPLHISPPPGILPYYLTIPRPNSAQSEAVINAIRSKSKSPTFIGLHPGSAPNYSWKRWPVKNFATLGKNLVKKHNAHILIFGNSSEVKNMKALRHAIGRNNSSIITNKLLTAAAIIKHCQMFISNDSGLMHISSALDIPTIGLFGPTDENKTGPRGKNSIAIRAANTKPVYDVNKSYDIGIEPHSTMLALKPDQVLQSVRSLLPPTH
jgi:heptosyltransferase-2